MGKIHGRHMVVKVGANDISTYCNSSDFGRKLDSHDISGYGAKSHSYSGGLLDGTFKMGGVYDSTASTGPRAILNAAIDAAVTVAVIRQPEGAGSGKPQDAFDLLITTYNESAPVADMIAWTAEGNISGDVNSTAQSA
jgi:hypothetical protein